MSEFVTPVEVPVVAAAPVAAPATSMLARWRADIEAEAKALGVDIEKLWALVKEHM